MSSLSFSEKVTSADGRMELGGQPLLPPGGWVSEGAGGPCAGVGGLWEVDQGLQGRGCELQHLRVWRHQPDHRLPCLCPSVTLCVNTNGFHSFKKVPGRIGLIIHYRGEKVLCANLRPLKCNLGTEL